MLRRSWPHGYRGLRASASSIMRTGFFHLSIKDPDADKGNITVILKTDPAEGLIAVDKTILNVDVEDNGQPGFLIIEGKLEDVNKSLDTLRFSGY